MSLKMEIKFLVNDAFSTKKTQKRNKINLASLYIL